MFEQTFERVGARAAGEQHEPLARRFPDSTPESRRAGHCLVFALADEEDGMTRRYDDPVDVRRRDEDPAEFLWRGRHYAVREVLAHWVETGAWWRTPVGAARVGSTAGSSALMPESPDSSVLSAEREVWRVEATPGRQHGVGIYDICFDWAAGGWTLLRSHD
jgi:hypothetical protein